MAAMTEVRREVIGTLNTGAAAMLDAPQVRRHRRADITAIRATLPFCRPEQLLASKVHLDHSLPDKIEQPETARQDDPCSHDISLCFRWSVGRRL